MALRVTLRGTLPVFALTDAGSGLKMGSVGRFGACECEYSVGRSSTLDGRDESGFWKVDILAGMVPPISWTRGDKLGAWEPVRPSLELSRFRDSDLLRPVLEILV